MKLIICRGLPGSGKTTRARAWVAEDPGSRARVNRDDLRLMLHDGVYLGEPTERQVRDLQHEAIRVLFSNGVDVVCDDTNLKPEIYESLVAIAGPSVTVETWDMRDVPTEVCIERDRKRRGRARVGAVAIMQLANEFL